MEEIEKQKYYGRLVLQPINAVPTDSLDCRPAIVMKGNQIHCQRCGAITSSRDGALPDHQFYCRKCINLGRVSTLVQLATIPEPNNFVANQSYLEWPGKLTAPQARCSKAIINSIDQQQNRLLWAVTGAGKTEMLFPEINHALQKQKRICVASPRIDVVLELFPRFQEAFPQAKIALLHGRSPAPYEYTQFVLCTTHQLLRFYHAFDVLIIDEVDSFPYAMNPELHYATKQARKLQGSTIYLTATPDGKLLQQSRQAKLATSYLTRRFHGHPLPEIKVVSGQNWIKKLRKGRLPSPLSRFIKEQIQAQRQFLIFVPKIEVLPKVLEALQQVFPTVKVLTVHAADPERVAKVQMMRKHEIDALITTTILERGVTFPGIDVAVLGADDAVFSMAALVQIAGRVGRSPQRPKGTVLFICPMLNRNIKRAQAQIKFMNRKASEC
ncbi:DEAD/DEAH box helicase [Pediococcus pentosaceus]|uniref:DEAD/DEAH box helicase n=1 Tax=Pediococcus pentosaceus TaxID=1255 RepID=UPI000258AE0B|nr:DEAD/DEAH box helicase family protein [Pediococcus pentosaceus]CCG91012.1 type III restriction enzyme, Res subunit [Pediococcus pentosaceus IE-3]